MAPTHIFINGCSFLTFRPKDNIMTHAGLELEKLMDLQRGGHLAAGGRGNRRTSITTKVWCERNPDIAKKTFFLIGITAGSRVDFPTDDGYKQNKFPELKTFWKTYSPQKNPFAGKFYKELWQLNLDLDQMCQYESIEAILNLQFYFKQKKYPYLMYNTLPDGPIVNKDVRCLSECIDQKRFYKFEYSHFEFIKEKNLIANKADPHPDREGHIYWAKQLLEFINANDLRTI